MRLPKVEGDKGTGMDLQRPPKSAEEIDALPAFGTDEHTSYVRTHADKFQPETLVHLLRAAMSAFETSIAESCGRALVGQLDPKTGRWSGGHCEGIIMTVARDHGLTRDRDALRDFRGDAHGEMWKAICDGRAKKPFWEERFGKALKDKCIDVARKHRRRAQRREAEVSTEDCAVPPAPVALQDALLGMLAEEKLLGAIRDLPERQARAGFLVWVEGLPIEGNGGHSACEVMGVSPRAVYKLLEKARAKLAEHPLIRSMLDDR
jgi:hypothetical protein